MSNAGVDTVDKDAINITNVYEKNHIKVDENDINNKFGYLPKFLKNIALEKHNRKEIRKIGCTDNIPEENKDNNFLESNSIKEIENKFYNNYDDEESYVDNKSQYKKIDDNPNKYKEFLKNNLLNRNKNFILPVINVDNIDDYMKKLFQSKNKQKETKPALNYSLNHFKNRISHFKYNSFNQNNSTASSNTSKIKIMKPEIKENFQKFEDEIQKKNRFKFDKINPKEFLRVNEKRMLDMKYKLRISIEGIRKLDSDENVRDTGSNLIFEDKNEFFKIGKIQNETPLNDSQILYNDILEYREFVETFNNKIKYNIIPDKNFSKNVFNIENDFYENIAHRIKSISKPQECEMSEISRDLGSTITQTSQNIESFITPSSESSYVYTDGSKITEIKQTEKNVLKLKDFNFKIKRDFNDKPKFKDKNKKIEIESTLKFLRKNLKMVKSVQSRMGTTKGKILVSNGNEVNESFVNSSFLVENDQHDEIQIPNNFKNFVDKNLRMFSKNIQGIQSIKRKNSNNFEEILKYKKNNNLYSELEKKMKAKNK